MTDDDLTELLLAEPLRRTHGPVTRRSDLEREVASIPYEGRLIQALRSAASILTDGRMHATARLLRLAADELASRNG